MPAVRPISLDLDYRPGVRVGPSLTFSPFRRGALITPVLTRRELDPVSVTLTFLITLTLFP
jgi:hypothetical protein